MRPKEDAYGKDALRIKWLELSSPRPCLAAGYLTILSKDTVLLTYPSISKQIQNIPVYTFDKIDGSNTRVEWTRKKGFHKFGTRTRLLEETERPLGEAVTIFQETMAEELEPLMRKTRNERITLFMEFVGESSFAGVHQEDEPHKLVLFDASFYKRGFLPPDEFMKLIGDTVETPGLLHMGKANSNLVELVKTGELEGMTFEGVICKSQAKHRGQHITFKIKNQAWLDKLRTYAKGDEALFQQLA